MCLENHTAYSTGKWTCDIGFGGSVSLCATALGVLLVSGGVEMNPGSGVETEKIMCGLWSCWDSILKTGAQCDTCGRWLHNNCGNVKAQLTESDDRCCLGNGEI
jgi:hypothetical protein